MINPRLNVVLWWVNYDELVFGHLLWPGRCEPLVFYFVFRLSRCELWICLESSPYLACWVFKLLETSNLHGVFFLTTKDYLPRIQSWECMELPSLRNSFTLLFLQHSCQCRGSMSLILIPRLQSYMGDKRVKQWFLLAAWQGQNSSRLLLDEMLFQSANLNGFT
jgi:hypothetical protein